MSEWYCWVCEGTWKGDVEKKEVEKKNKRGEDEDEGEGRPKKKYKKSVFPPPHPFLEEASAGVTRLSRR